MRADDDRTVATDASPTKAREAILEEDADTRVNGRRIPTEGSLQSFVSSWELTAHDRRALTALAISGPATPEQLARAIGISTSAAACTQHQLRDRGLVISVPAGSARPQTVLVLSTAGRAIVDDVRTPNSRTRQTNRD